jgi:hypothetical protein
MARKPKVSGTVAQFARMSTEEMQKRIAEVRATGRTPSAAALEELARRLANGEKTFPSHRPV